MLNSGCQRPSACNGGLQVSHTETCFFQRKNLGLSLCQQLLPVPVEKAGTFPQTGGLQAVQARAGSICKTALPVFAFGNSLKQKLMGVLLKT